MYFRWLRGSVPGLLFAVGALTGTCQADSGLQINSPNDPQVAARAVVLDPSCRPAPSLQELSTGAIVGDFSCISDSWHLVCARAAQPAMASSALAIAGKVLKGQAMSRAEQNTADLILILSGRSLVVSNMVGVQQLNRGLKATTEDAFLSSLPSSRNNSYIAVTRSPGASTLFPAGGAAVARFARAQMIGKQRFNVQTATLNVGATPVGPDGTHADFIGLRSDRPSGNGLAITAGGMFVCSSRGLYEMISDARLETPEKPQITLVDTRLERDADGRL